MDSDRRRYVLVLLLMAVMPEAISETARRAVTEYRRHVRLVNHDQVTYYDLTVIVRM